MIDYDKRFSRLERRGLLAPIKGLPCPLCKVDFSYCKHSIGEVERVIQIWRDRQTARKMRFK